MLILRRKRGQSIVLGKSAEVIIQILQEENGIITLGIEAPKSILVDRKEVYLKRIAEGPLSEFSKLPKVSKHSAFSEHSVKEMTLRGSNDAVA